MERDLSLWIETCSCKCGQRWTNSYLTYGFGGTPTPLDEDRLMVERIIPTTKNHSHCFRCAPLGLGLGWKSAAGGPAKESKAVQPAIDELLE